MDNMRGAALMVLAMLGFAVNDMFIKLMAGALPIWQILGLLGLGGGGVFGALTLWQGQPLFTRAFLTPTMYLRSIGELVGTVCFMTAIILTPLSSASAILQATPLAVTLGAALFLKEPVGWRRWAAIWAGFFGVILVVRPGLEGFSALSLFAVVAVFGLSARDLATRMVPSSVSSYQLSFIGFLTLIPASLLMSLFSARAFVTPSPVISGQLVGMVLLGVVAYLPSSRPCGWARCPLSRHFAIRA